MNEELVSKKVAQALEIYKARSEILEIFLKSFDSKDDPEMQQYLSVAKVAYLSNLYPSLDRPDKILMLMLIGKSMGIDPINSIGNIYPITNKHGQISFKIHYTQILAKIRQSGTYDYEILERSDKQSSIQFYRLNGKERSPDGDPFIYTIDDARRAGLLSKTNWINHLKTMLVAAGVGHGHRIHCPDLFSGISVYSDGEEIIDITPNEFDILEKEKPGKEEFVNQSEESQPTKVVKNSDYCKSLWSEIDTLAKKNNIKNWQDEYPELSNKIMDNWDKDWNVVKESLEKIKRDFGRKEPEKMSNGSTSQDLKVSNGSTKQDPKMSNGSTKLEELSAKEQAIQICKNRMDGLRTYAKAEKKITNLRELFTREVTICYRAQKNGDAKKFQEGYEQLKDKIDKYDPNANTDNDSIGLEPEVIPPTIKDLPDSPVDKDGNFDTNKASILMNNLGARWKNRRPKRLCKGKSMRELFPEDYAKMFRAIKNRNLQDFMECYALMKSSIDQLQEENDGSNNN
jgi:hypothetical protein